MVYALKAKELTAKNTGRPFVVLELINDNGFKKDVFTDKETLKEAGFTDDMLSPSMSDLRPLSISWETNDFGSSKLRSISHA